MPVYADVLLVINGFTNYLLLLCNMKILKLNTSRLRLLLGALTGSLFSLKIFLPEFSKVVELLLRFAFTCLIILFAYKFTSIKEFLKAYICFFAVSFIFSGLMIAVILFINPPDLIYDNGVIYYDISFLSTVILTCGGFTFISLGEKILKRRTDINLLFETTVTHKSKSVSGRGFADSGNTLKEPFSGKEVIVADYSYIKKIVPKEINEYIETGKVSSSDTVIRFIPVSTVSGAGLLPCFNADKISVKSAKTLIQKENVFIAVSKERICNGEFEFILNPLITEVN